MQIQQTIQPADRRAARTALGAALLTLVSCGGPRTDSFEIRFDARVVDAPARCGARFEGVGAEGATVELSDARFYVSNVTLLRDDGTRVPLDLEQASPWQHGDVALLDFEDATGRCSNTGTAQTNTVVRGSAPPADYRGLSFDLGVSPALNHLDAPTAPTPLNLNALYWNWRLGYIFTKVEFWNPEVRSGEATASGEGQDAGRAAGGAGSMPPPGPTVTYLVHIGSTGCESPAPTVPPTEPCSRPNRVPIVIEGFDPAVDVVGLDLAGLVAGIDVTRSTLRPPGCMAAPVDPDCVAVFANLGLDLATGRCATDCSDQKLASRRPASG